MTMQHLEGEGGDTKDGLSAMTPQYWGRRKSVGTQRWWEEMNASHGTDDSL